MNRNIILFFFIISVVTSFGQEFRNGQVSEGALVGLVSGRGSTKSEAYMNAVSRVPGNAVTADITYNGFSSTDGTGKSWGNYTCYIKWKRITSSMMSPSHRTRVVR